MHIVRQANDEEFFGIIKTLCAATERPHSESFLARFPWTSTTWRLAEFENDDLENLFLFWDGSAWGEDPKKPPRRLKQGVKDFMAFAGDITKPNYQHYVEILKLRDDFRTGYKLTRHPELIVIGDNHGPNSSFMILDGNHRAVAALWWAYEKESREHLPHQLWLGLSPQMSHYDGFKRILLANQE